MTKLIFALIFTSSLFASDLKTGSQAPLFELKNQEGKVFKLADRKNKGWTVVFFYPKAGTPGCTKQACAFRDAIDKVRQQGAEVYGISSDTVESQAKFHKEHKLKFDLLADSDAKVIEDYGVKMMAVDIAKRWTFIIDPNLTIRSIDDKVDPTMDPERVTQKLIELKKS